MTQNFGPWGEPSAWDVRFAYTGQIALQEAQLYHYKARVYDPILGRFLQTDPIGQEDDLNLYAYVKGDPVNPSDPAGTEIVAMRAAQREQISGYINERASGGKFQFDQQGRLEFLPEPGVTDRKSQYYTDALISSINDADKIVVVVTQTLGGKDIDTEYGGGVTAIMPQMPSTDRLVAITGNSNNQASAQGGGTTNDSPADILAHELVSHAIPQTVKSDTGNGTDNENKVREQSGLRLRTPDPSHKE